MQITWRTVKERNGEVMKVVIKYQVVDFLDKILSDELKPDSGLNDPTELALMRSIRDKIRQEGSEPTLTTQEYKWLKEYMSRWIDEY